MSGSDKNPAKRAKLELARPRRPKTFWEMMEEFEEKRKERLRLENEKRNANKKSAEVESIPTEKDMQISEEQIGCASSTENTSSNQNVKHSLEKDEENEEMITEENEMSTEENVQVFGEQVQAPMPYFYRNLFVYVDKVLKNEIIFDEERLLNASIDDDLNIPADDPFHPYLVVDFYSGYCYFAYHAAILIKLERIPSKTCLFSNLCDGLSQRQICRFFVVVLELVNHYCVEISNSDGQNFTVKLLPRPILSD